MDDVIQRVREVFSDEGRGHEFTTLNARYSRQARYLFSDFEPTHGGPRFEDRFVDWLKSTRTSDEAAQLFRLLSWVYYMSEEEAKVFHSLAYNGPVSWWLGEGLKFGDRIDDFKIAIAERVDRCWFGSITDSLHVSTFCHLNGIVGADLRPEWRALWKVGDADRLREHIRERDYRYLVLLEDFIGSGTQAAGAIKFAAGFDLPILVIPLIICPKGTRTLSKVIAEIRGQGGPPVTLSPIVRLPEALMVSSSPHDGESCEVAEFRALALGLHDLVSDGSYDTKFPFGFRDTGALAVTHSNCPNNTLPILHSRASTWSAPFPRSGRV